MAHRNARPSKLVDLITIAQEHWKQGQVTVLAHAYERQSERAIHYLEIEEIIFGGYHEKRKDQYKPEYEAWCYSVRGKTQEERELRVIVTFDEGMLVVTVIDLDCDK